MRRQFRRSAGYRAGLWLLLAVLMLSGAAGGCSWRIWNSVPEEGSRRQAGADEAAKPEENEARVSGPEEQRNDGGSQTLSGRIQLAGSSSMEEAASVLAESFMEKYPGVIVNVEFNGSGAGILAAVEGSADIGNSSRYLTEEEKAQGAVENIIGLDGIAVCVDGTNTVAGLTREQLKGIYTGEIRNWSRLGGSDMPIVVVGREAGAGTRSAFEELLDVEGRCTYANELDSTGAVLARVAATPGAIGYVSFDAVARAEPGTVRALPLDGAEPGAENVKSGSYPLYRPFIMVTRGEISAQSSLIQAWFDYVYSGEGQRTAEKAGMIPLDINIICK